MIIADMEQPAAVREIRLVQSKPEATSCKQALLPSHGVTQKASVHINIKKKKSAHTQTHTHCIFTTEMRSTVTFKMINLRETTRENGSVRCCQEALS